MAAAPDIHERALDYALRAIKLHAHLRKLRNEAAWTIGKQYLRSATSIGANLAEAHSGESRADFIHKCCIAQKEARESRYWLMLLQRSGIIAEARMSPLLKETNELIAILAAIIVKTRKG